MSAAGAACASLENLLMIEKVRWKFDASRFVGRYPTNCLLILQEGVGGVQDVVQCRGGLTNMISCMEGVAGIRWPSRRVMTRCSGKSCTARCKGRVLRVKARVRVHLRQVGHLGQDDRDKLDIAVDQAANHKHDQSALWLSRWQNGHQHDSGCVSVANLNPDETREGDFARLNLTYLALRWGLLATRGGRATWVGSRTTSLSSGKFRC